MSSRPIDSVIFDLGGVLIDWNPRYLYRGLFADESTMEKFLSEVCHQRWNERQDAGRSFAEGIAELVLKFPHEEMRIRAYVERWPEMLGGVIQGTVDILNQLRGQGRHQLLALSNWSKETFPHARSRFSFFENFDAVLLSGEERLIKPDARFFSLLSERHGVAPERAIFIDDVEKNIEAARDLGFQAIRFTDSGSLRESLRRFGVLDP